MKFFLLNGSPRPNNNTGKLLAKCKEGIVDTLEEHNISDARVEVINLFSLDFKGCMSCFSCKLLDGPFYGRCPINDDLKDLLPELWDCDGFVIGSPIYFSDVTGQVRNLIERLVFPKLVYGGDSISEKRMPTGLILTMNAPREFAKESYNVIENNISGSLSVAFNPPLIVSAYNTVQFNDYSKYENYLFSEEDKLAYEEEFFPKVLDEAYHMGVNIALSSIL